MQVCGRRPSRKRVVWGAQRRDAAIEPILLQADAAVWQANLLSPPVLFFAVGLIAVAIRSDLEIPESFKKVLSLYLLFAIGFKGGAMLRESGLTNDGLAAMAVATALSAVTPLWLFPLLKGRLGSATAGGVAATYGSVSAVTFMAAVTMLRDQGTPFGGHMVAAMALMEFPALIVGVLLAQLFPGRQASADNSGATPALGPALRAASTNGPIILLICSMIAGAVTTDEGRRITAPMWSELFSGLLCFYLLDLGLVAGRGAKEVFRKGVTVVVTAVLFPPVNAALALLICWAVGLPRGDTFLMMVMAASASYIAAPAALRIALPQAQPGVYVPMALTLTFPLNIIIGLPVYWIASAVVQ